MCVPNHSTMQANKHILHVPRNGVDVTRSVAFCQGFLPHTLTVSVGFVMCLEPLLLNPFVRFYVPYPQPVINAYLKYFYIHILLFISLLCIISLFIFYLNSQ